MVSQVIAHQKALLVKHLKQGCLDRPAGGTRRCCENLHSLTNQKCKRHQVSMEVGEDLLRFFFMSGIFIAVNCWGPW